MPSFGNLQTAAHASSDYLLIPSELAKFSLSGIEKQMETSARTKKYLNPNLEILGVILNKVHTKPTLVQSYQLNEIMQTYGDFVFDTKINLATVVEESQAVSEPISVYSSNSKTAKQFGDLTQELLYKLGY